MNDPSRYIARVTKTLSAKELVENYRPIPYSHDTDDIGDTGNIDDVDDVDDVDVGVVSTKYNIPTVKQFPDHMYYDNNISTISDEAMVLANIDAITNFSYLITGYLVKKEYITYSFVSLGSDIKDRQGMDGFTEYIYFRHPRSYGWVYAPPLSSSNYGPRKTDHIDFDRLNMAVGPYRGDMAENFSWWIDYIKSVQLTVDLVVSNNSNISMWPINMFAVMSMVKDNGQGVVAIDRQSFTDMTVVNGIYLLSQIFKDLYIIDPFKNIANQSGNRPIYIVGKNRMTDPIDGSQQDDLTISSVKDRLASAQPDDKFLSWLTNIVDEYNRDVDASVDADDSTDLSRADTLKYNNINVTALWNLSYRK